MGLPFVTSIARDIAIGNAWVVHDIHRTEDEKMPARGTMGITGSVTRGTAGYSPCWLQRRYFRQSIRVPTYRAIARAKARTTLRVMASTVAQTDKALSWTRPMAKAVATRNGINMVAPLGGG